MSQLLQIYQHDHKAERRVPQAKPRRAKSADGATGRARGAIGTADGSESIEAVLTIKHRPPMSQSRPR